MFKTLQQGLQHDANVKRLKEKNNSKATVVLSQEEKCIIAASKEVSSKAHDNENVRMLDNGIVEIGLERIRIHHSNPNYKKEIEGYEKQLSEDKEENQPRKKTTCIFNPFILPIDTREKLHK
jgi:hypothetical protein